MLHLAFYTMLLLSASIVVIGFLLRRVLTIELKILHFFFIFDLSVSLLQLYLSKHGQNNHWTMHFAMPIEYAWLILVCAHWVSSSMVRRYLHLSTLVYLVVWGIVIMTVEDIATFSPYNKPLESLLLVLVSLYILYEANKDQERPLMLQPRFWISAGLLIYFSGTFLLLSMSKFLLHLSAETLRFAWGFHNLVTVVVYLLYLSGFLCQVQRLKSGGS